MAQGIKTGIIINDRLSLNRLGEAFSVHECDFAALGRRPWEWRRIESGKLGSMLRRKMVAVEYGRKDYLADRVTGSLYGIDGRCRTSSFLRLLPISGQPVG